MSNLIAAAFPDLYIDLTKNWEEGSSWVRAEIVTKIVAKAAFILGVLSIVALVGYGGGYPLDQHIKTGNFDFTGWWNKTGLATCEKILIGPSSCFAIALLGCFARWCISSHQRAQLIKGGKSINVVNPDL